MSAGRVALLGPIDLGLADAIGEAEWLAPGEIARVQPSHHFEGLSPRVRGEPLHEAVELPRLSEKHDYEMGHAGGDSPLPLRGRVAAYIPQAAGAALLRHS